MVTSDSTALKDLTKIYSDLFFSLRIGLIAYEKVLALAAMWAEAKTNPLTQKTLPAGDWNVVRLHNMQPHRPLFELIDFIFQ